MKELKYNPFCTLYQDGRDFVIIHNKTLTVFGRYKDFGKAKRDFKQLCGGGRLAA